MIILRNISRVLTGLVFTFSGFVKGIDPWGFTYKLIDYFEAFDLNWLEPAALYLAVLASAIEFLIGFALIFNARTKLASWGLLIFMGFFTPLTLYLALKNPVNDCGCFGDAIIMTNWETFFKNLGLFVFTLIVFIKRKKFKPFWNLRQQNIIVIIGALIILGFSWYSYRHLPVIDFRAWKVGSDMTTEAPTPDVYLTYKNKNTGKTKEWHTKELPYSDTSFTNNWEFVSQRVVEPEMPENTLSIEDESGNEATEKVFNRKGYNFILIAHNLKTTDVESMVEMQEFYKQALKDSLGFSVLTGSLFPVIADFKRKHDLTYPFFIADDIALKTVVRANPGLMLLKEGIIKEKWHYNDFPQYEEFSEEYSVE